jgi:putative transposase
MIKSHYSCAELAEMKLPSLPSTKKGMIDLANRQKWPSQKRTARGGGLEYQPPKEVMNLIRDKQLKSAIVVTQNIAPNMQYNVVSAQQNVSAAELKDWQRDTASARAAICAEVKRLSAFGGMQRAIQTVIDMAAQNKLPQNLQQLVPIANAKAGTERSLSRSSIYRWMKEAESGFTRLALLNCTQN